MPGSLDLMLPARKRGNETGFYQENARENRTFGWNCEFSAAASGANPYSLPRRRAVSSASAAIAVE